MLLPAWQPWLYHLSRGIDNRQVTVDRRRKSLSVENTFANDLSGLPQCLNEIPSLSQQLAIRLRRVDDDYKVVKLYVKIKFSDFSTTTIERSASAVSLSELQSLCAEAYNRKNMPVRLLGVGDRFIDLREDNNFLQLELFDINNTLLQDSHPQYYA